jgi:hypothetical protein
VSAAKDMHATRDETLKNVIDMYNWLWPLKMTDPFPLPRGCHTSTKPQPSDSNKNLVSRPRRDLTPRLVGWLTVGRNVTLTLS